MCDLAAGWWTVCGPLSGAAFRVIGADGVVAEGLTADDGAMCVEDLGPGSYEVELRAGGECPVAVTVSVPSVPRELGGRPLPTWSVPEPWAGVRRWVRFERGWERAGGNPSLRDWSACSGDAVHVVQIDRANRRPRRWEVRSALVCSDPGTWSITDTRWSDGRLSSSRTEYDLAPDFWWSLLGGIADDRFVTRPPADARGPTVVLVELVGVAELWRAVPADEVPDWASALLGR